MKVTYNWLKEFVDFDMNPSDLAEALTMAGLEVVAMEDLGARYAGCLVGRVLEKNKHPNADRLSVCRADVGKEEVTVVCGAPNVAEGQKVPVATVGTKLPDGLVIKQATIRGVASCGMICSEVELGLGEDASGIMVLSDEAKVGAPLAEALGLDDVVFELELTPNRPDCLSVMGVAREIAAITGNPLRTPEIEVVAEGEPIDQWASVEIEDPKACPRYAARVITGVKVGPSPDWMRRRLEAVGLRAINNVVDATNYVLMELGHPLHAFDLNKVVERKIVVRRARDGEQLITLDGELRDLDKEVLVIADPRKAVAIAGVMGGSNTELAGETVDVLLESAYFDPVVVRRGSKKLGLSTEASQRFERGMDWDGNIRAMDRAVQWILRIAGGKAASGVIDVYPKKRKRAVVSLRPERANQILGTGLSGSRMAEMLEALGCKVASKNEMIETEIPSFRPDIEREIDLVEEVARIVGYNNIPNREVGGGSLWVATRTDLRLASRTRAVLTGLGLDEVVTSSLTDPDRASEDAVRLANPSGRPMSVLRTDLISGLLEVARWNLNRQAGAVRIFEIGKVFAPGAGPSGTEEEERVAGVLVCETRRDHWHEKKQALDFYDVKGIVEAYLDSMAQAELEVAPVQDRWYEEGVAGKILLGGKEVGRCGRLHRDVLERFDFGEAVYGFDVSLSEVLPFFEEVRTFELLARYPAVDRDFAVVVPESLSWGELLGEIRETDTGLIESVEMFDVYRGKPLGEGEKSLAFSVRFRSKERTLSEVEVGALCDRIVERLSERFGARLRS
ncbi:MAG: phenylalanine--tRNA ligase subunit beta [Candidatus Latescibacteria bacterium]|nr:phenylalanine--tRNA ligase subunit beta [Candidatus Latescibacterota bacterium]